MTSDFLVRAAIIAVLFIVVIVAFAMLSLYRSLSKLHAAFAKLGYTNREDAKKYFEEASQKVAEMNQSYYEQHTHIIEEGLRKVLSESNLVVEETLLKAQKDAGDIIIKAQQQGEEILASTRRDAEKYYDQAIQDAVDTLEWTLEQYLMGHMDIKQHEEVIIKLVNTYINERKPQ